MTLPTIDQAHSWRGLTLVATDDEPVGKIEAIYVDRTTRQPEWALVDTGLFGSSRTFVPLADAAQRGDTVHVPHEAAVIREAPRLELATELSEEDEARLYAHYGIQYTTEDSSSGLPAGEAAPADATAELPYPSRLEADASAPSGVGSGTGATTPAAGTSWSGGTVPPSMEYEQRRGRLRDGRAYRRLRVGVPRLERLRAARKRVTVGRRRWQTAHARYINLWFTREPGGAALPKRKPLRKGEAFHLRVNIGPFDSKTILRDARPFPSQKELYKAFPETRSEPIPVEVSVFTADLDIAVEARTRRLVLHSDEATNPVYFRLSAGTTGRAEMRVCCFYQNHLLQSINVTANVTRLGVVALRRHTAQVETTFTADFTTAASLPPRGLWLGVNETADSSHAINVRGEEVPPLLRRLEPKIEAALLHTRKALLEVSFDHEKDDNDKVVMDERTGEPKKAYRFNRENRPRTADDDAARRRRFRDDLVTLARAGAGLYEAIFGTGAVPTAEERAEVERLKQGLQKTLQREQVIQVSRLKHMEDIWPWAVVYDLLVDPVDVKDVCLSFRGPDGTTRPYSKGAQDCSHLDPRTGLNDPTIVCPYGFWGFKHMIEQPTQPGGKQAFADLVLGIEVKGDPVLNMPLAAELLDLEDEHIQRMRDARFNVLETYQAIVDAFTPALNPPEPHALYFLCHGKYDQNGNFYLEVGEGKALPPAILDRLGFNWSQSHGIVFINGCHTVDLKPSDLSNIMAPFLKGQASGIVGSEISVHTFLAREFAQNFFNRFIPDGQAGQPVGQIIKDLRLELLAKFNPLGLVYTPYCSADLQMTHGLGT